MDLEKMYETLGMDKLDEEKAKELKQAISDTIELKVEERAKEISQEKLDEEKKELVEVYEKKFDEYKDKITSKFSDFVDEIMEKEMQLPEVIKKYAQVGEKYQPVLEKLALMLSVDEGSLDEEAKSLLKQSSDEIDSLKDKVNTLTSENLELKDDASSMAHTLYIREKCDGLPDAKKEKVISILEGIKDKDEIDRKFPLIVEAKETKKIEEKTLVCSECGKKVEVDEESDDTTCPECDGKLVAEKKKDEKKEEKKEKIEESDIRDVWKTMIRENRV